MKHVVFYFPCLIVVILLFGCHKQQQEKIVARVGDAVLTFNDAKVHIDTTHIPFEDQLQTYALRWVDDELLYQEAVRKGIENSEQFQMRLQETKRQLVNQAFLDQVIYNDTLEITEQSLQEYFQNHSQEFFVEENVSNMNLITFTTREQASVFASSIQRGTPWVEAANEVVSDSANASGIVSQATGKFYTQHSLYPTELWKVASTMNVNEASFPVKTSLGYTVIQVLATTKKGEPAQYQLVCNEVRERFLIERRRKRYIELINNLRKQYKVKILVSQPSLSDSINGVSHE